GGNLTEQQQAAVVETIADYYSLKLGDQQLILNDNTRKSLILFLMGLLFAGAVWLLRFTQVLGYVREMPLLLFWFFTWEFASLAGLERSDLILARTEAAQLASIKVIFREQFVDKPVDKGMAERIFAEISDEDSKTD